MTAKNQMNERKAKAEQELRRVNAIMKVYEFIEDTYHSVFCELETDENGELIADADGNYNYKEKDVHSSYRFDYDEELYRTSLEIMKEVLNKVANMK